MSQQELYVFEIFVNMKAIVRPVYLLHCSKEIIKFLCNCLFNIVSGHIAMAENVSKKKLERHRRWIETLCDKEIGLLRKRQNWSASHGLKLLALIQSSSRHLKVRHGIER